MNSKSTLCGTLYCKHLAAVALSGCQGKAKAPVEFGAKFDFSLDIEGYRRIKKISFEAYNESA